MTARQKVIDDIRLLASRAFYAKMPDLSLALTHALEDVENDIVNQKTEVALAKAGINMAERTMVVDGKKIKPTSSEFMIACYLARRPHIVRSRESIMNAAGIHIGSADQCIGAHVKRMRVKGISAIKTSHGDGFFWDARA